MGLFDKLLGKSSHADDLVIYAPMDGEAVPVSQVNDPTFSEEILGKGIAIRPTGTQVVAPCDATVEMMFDTGHAVRLQADNGAEVLIHVGLDTVNLKGAHYTVHAANGDKVKKGQLLITFDREAIKADGYDTITPMVICNSDNFSTVEGHTGPVKAGDVLLTLKK